MTLALTAAAVLTLASQYSDWDPQWVLWQVFDAGTGHGESSGRPDAYNPAGPFRGLLQVSDANAIRFGYQPEEMYDPAKNLAAAHRLWLERGTAPWPSAVKYPGRASVGVSADGWLDWAIKMPATVNHVNGGVNAVKGIFFHSAEGFATTLLDPHSQWGYNGDLSWHLTNTLDGKLYQHYPFTAQCWHATAANNEYVGMENEGLTPEGHAVGPELNAAQIANAQRVIADLSKWKGWIVRRPSNASDTTATLYQHGEVVRFGGTGSSCPNGRIPWEKILKPAQGDEMFTIQSNGGKLTGQQAQGSYLFDTKPLGLPAGKRVRLQVWTSGDAVEFYHGVPDQNNRDAGRVYAPYGIVEVVTDPNGLCYAGPPGANFDVQGLGFYS